LSIFNVIGPEKRYIAGENKPETGSFFAGKTLCVKHDLGDPDLVRR